MENIPGGRIVSLKMLQKTNIRLAELVNSLSTMKCIENTMTFHFKYEMQLIGLKLHLVEHITRAFKRYNFQ